MTTSQMPPLKGLPSPLLHAYAPGKEKAALSTSSQPLESFPKHQWTDLRVPKKTVREQFKISFPQVHRDIWSMACWLHNSLYTGLTTPARPQ